MNWLQFLNLSFLAHYKCLTSPEKNIINENFIKCARNVDIIIKNRTLE